MRTPADGWDAWADELRRQEHTGELDAELPGDTGVNSVMVKTYLRDHLPDPTIYDLYPGWFMKQLWKIYTPDRSTLLAYIKREQHLDGTDRLTAFTKMDFEWSFVAQGQRIDQIMHDVIHDLIKRGIIQT